MSKILCLVLLFEVGRAWAEAPYLRDETADGQGAAWAGDVDVAPAFLVAQFGAPAEGDGLRVSGLFTFRGTDGSVFTIHDYKQTTLWAPDEGLPTPEAFWRSARPAELSLGSRRDARDPEVLRFKAWLLEAYDRWRGRAGQ